MRNSNIKITTEVVFNEKVKAVGKTRKIALRIVEIDINTGTAIIESIAFKNKSSQDQFIADTAQYETDKQAIKAEKEAFYIKYESKKPELELGANPTLRASLKAEEEDILAREKLIVPPEKNTNKSQLIYSDVQIPDTSVFDGLLDQISI